MVKSIKPLSLQLELKMNFELELEMKGKREGGAAAKETIGYSPDLMYGWDFSSDAPFPRPPALGAR